MNVAIEAAAAQAVAARPPEPANTALVAAQSPAVGLANPQPSDHPATQRLWLTPAFFLVFAFVIDVQGVCRRNPTISHKTDVNALMAMRPVIGRGKSDIARLTQNTRHELRRGRLGGA